MAYVSAFRITPNRPIQHVEIDYAGPINTKCPHTRKAIIFKSYLCLSICLCTKTTDVKVVPDLNIEAFFLTLKRFVSCRDYPSDMFSDNGQNFIGPSTYFKSFNKLTYKVKIQVYSANLYIT